MKTKFSFKDSVHGQVSATPEKVILSGRSGNIWTFYGYDPVTGADGVHLAKTFMPDRATRAAVVDQFQLMT